MTKVLTLSKTGRVALALLTAATAFAGHAAQAQVVGGTSAGSTAPFGGDAAGASQRNYLGEYQQIYSSSSFSGVTTIRQISFSSALPGSTSDLGFFNTPEQVAYNFTVSLFTTAATPTNASTTFASNRAVNLVPVFTVTQTSALQANGSFDLTVNLPTALIYTPSLGNLLLDVNLTSANVLTAGGGQDFFQAGASPLVGTVANSSGTGTPQFQSNFGLLTRFSAAPEPSPAIMIAIGMSAAGLLVARRRFAARRA